MAFLTIYFAITFTFIVIKSMPGDPIDALAQAFVRQYYMRYEEARALAEAVAPFMPKGTLLEQYVDYVTKFFRGDLGVSISVSTGTPVTKILADAIPWTVLVVASALVISFGLGTLVGMVMAYKRGGKFDSIMLTVFSTLRSIPEYIIAILLLSVLGFQLGLFPIRGRYSYEALMLLKEGNIPAFIANVLWHASLPILTWVTIHIGGWALAMRGGTIGVLGEDFITYARVRGLPERRIVTRYVGRNAILPLFTSFMLSLGFMFGGSIVIEYIFSYQGVGLMLYQAVQRRDWFLMLGAFNIIVVAVVLGAFLADLLYGILDPRVRKGASM